MGSSISAFLFVRKVGLPTLASNAIASVDLLQELSVDLFFVGRILV